MLVRRRLGAALEEEERERIDKRWEGKVVIAPDCVYRNGYLKTNNACQQRKKCDIFTLENKSVVFLVVSNLHLGAGGGGGFA